MLLGKYIRCQISQEGVEVFYQELSLQERLECFETLKKSRSIDIYYPFVHLNKNTRQEITTPKEGWFITEDRAHLLSIGEHHFRKISIELLARNKEESPIIYDPACSTGEFLGELKQAFPNAMVIGQDVSEQMCNYAKNRLDKVIHNDSISPGVENNSCDYIFFRFLNAEVVSTSLAKKLFARIMKCLKSGGTAVLFGHTPVLISYPLIRMLGYHIVACNAYVLDHDALCQYYIIKNNV